LKFQTAKALDQRKVRVALEGLVSGAGLRSHVRPEDGIYQ
jgi:hypothetical protein